ncbi:unnamed protein product [Miscanthus lutarioriparius]|uniref:Uncharacterized protein n=1 Tax=Miscanthus lutarioriparius TaxID=422564 RepID=A0A811P3A8_9POAL|nr:unnamed protein product [Miscanthus lutarioriparius]
MLLSGLATSHDGAAAPTATRRRRCSTTPAASPYASTMATLSASAPFPTITLGLTQAPGGLAGAAACCPHGLGLHRPPGGIHPVVAPAMPFSAPSPLASMFLPQRAPTGLPTPTWLVARQQQSVMETVTAAIAADPNFTTALAAAISSVMAGAGAAHQAQPTPRGVIPATPEIRPTAVRVRPQQVRRQPEHMQRLPSRLGSRRSPAPRRQLEGIDEC